MKTSKEIKVSEKVESKESRFDQIRNAIKDAKLGVFLF